MIGYDFDIILLSGQTFWKLGRALEATGLNLEKFQRKVEEVNEKLELFKQRKLEYQNSVLVVPGKIENIEEIRFSVNRRNFTLSEVERQSLVYLLIFSELKRLSVGDFQELLIVSKNTILTDIKKLRSTLKGVELKYTRKSGFSLLGDEEERIKMAWQFLQKLSENNGFYVLSKFLNQSHPLNMFEIDRQLQSQIKAMKIEVVNSRYIPMLLYVGTLKSRFRKHPSERENYLIKALIIGMSNGESQNKENDFLYRVAFDIMDNVMKLTAVEFEDFMRTFLALLAHLTPAYFRIKNHFEIENVLLDRIKSEYYSLFVLMDSALSPLKELVGEISEAERAYFVILFGGEIYKNKYPSKQICAVVLSINGISSSIIMQKRLEMMFPSIKFILSTGVSHFEKLPKNSYDIIFSTRAVKSDKKVYLMSVLPETTEENELYNRVLHDFSLPGFIQPTAQELLSAVEPYIELKKGINRQKLIRIINRKLGKNDQMSEKAEGIFLSQLLENGHVFFNTETIDWKGAIWRAAKPLLLEESIQESYISSMICRVENLEVNINLGHGIILAHNKIEDGVNRMSMSLMKSRIPITFDDLPISIIIVLAATDGHSHLKALSSLAQILSSKENLKTLLLAQSEEEILSLVRKVEVKN